MFKKLQNFAIAVHSIKEAADLYARMFGLQVMQPPGAPSQYGFRNAFLGNGREAFIELLEPTDPNGAVARFLKSKGEGVYLVSFEVDNLKEAVRHVRANGGRITGLPEGEEPGPETRTVWVHPASAKGVFVQLAKHG